MGLKEYRRKRHFERTPEPLGEEPRSPGSKGAPHPGPGAALFVVQKHAARRLHYDFRLELDGVLKSWAVPLGPSLDPADKRLAVQVEDHPVEYGDFEGVIPEGEYGGGTVLLWDRGSWEPIGDAAEGLRRGRLKFRLGGQKLRGGWNLVRLARGSREGSRAAARVSWLLIKKRDAHARAVDEGDVREEQPLSVLSGRSLEQIALDRDRVWSSGKPAAGRRPRVWPRRPRATRRPDPSKLDGARRAPLPEQFFPQLATPVKQVPEGNEWLHELKLDGYRLLARLQGGKATLHTRRGLDWTSCFPRVAEALAELRVDECLLDGEVVVLARDGTSDFQALQNAMGRGGGQADPRLTYFVFDIPFCQGFDLRRVPLVERKRFLEGLLGGGSTVRFSKHIRGRGPEVFRHACSHRLEGIICKRADSLYESRRSGTWLKVKCLKRQEFVIGGYTNPAGSRSNFGALLLGYYDDEGRLVYCGKVGTGFNATSLRELGAELRAREIKRPPFQLKAPRDAEARRAHWVRPELVAEINFGAWTEDSILRQPSFLGLRKDKPANEVRREKEVKLRPSESAAVVQQFAAAGVRLTHPERVLYPDSGLTKAALAAHYLSVEALILPHLRQRPLAVVRCPSGQGKKCFFQKSHKVGMPPAVESVTIRPRDRQANAQQLMISDLAGLLGLVQMSVLEIHPWGCRADRVEQPDVMVFDLDPGAGLPWAALLEAAVELRDRLHELGLESFVKTSGGKGLHVQLPLRRHLDWKAHKEFARAVAEDLARRRPQRYVASPNLARRKGRVFIDYLRNVRGSTSVAPYSTRARPGAPVSTPIRWDELPTLASADFYRVTNFAERLTAVRGADPWQDYFEIKQSVVAKAMRALGLS